MIKLKLKHPLHFLQISEWTAWHDDSTKRFKFSRHNAFFFAYIFTVVPYFVQSITKMDMVKKIFLK